MGFGSREGSVVPQMVPLKIKSVPRTMYNNFCCPGVIACNISARAYIASDITPLLKSGLVMRD